jgi:hypothetical protein
LEDDYDPQAIMPDKDFDGLFEANGGRVRKGPGGQDFVVMPVESFKHIVRSLVGLGQGDRKLLSAIIDQEGGAVMLAERFVKGAQPRGLFVEVDEVSGAHTIRHLSS